MKNFHKIDAFGILKESNQQVMGKMRSKTHYVQNKAPQTEHDSTETIVVDGDLSARKLID